MINKQGQFKNNRINVENLYTGKQYNCSNGILTYNYVTDIFKPYGFNTCTRLDPVDNPYYYNSETKQFMVYSYLVDATIQYELGQGYTLSLYAYVSKDCNANFNLALEHSNTWIDNYQGRTSFSSITDSTKGEVFWVWGKCKASTSDGKIYCMFYPNMNQANVFTKGYQLFAGITLYKGNELLKPMNNGFLGNGFIESQNTPPRTNFQELCTVKRIHRNINYPRGGVTYD